MDASCKRTPLFLVLVIPVTTKSSPVVITAWLPSPWKMLPHRLKLLRPVSNVVLLPCRTQMNLARQWHEDSTAAVSNVEPNTVAPNSKEKTNHPSSGKSPFKIAEGNLSEDREKFALFKTILNARRHRKWMQQSILNTVIARKRLLLPFVSSVILFLVSFRESQLQAAVLLSCLRFQRNLCWWNTVWNTYSEKRFKQTLRVSRGTFQFILNRIRHDLERDVVCEDPIPPDMRLAICLYRLGHGDHYFTIAEMFRVGVSTVAGLLRMYVRPLQTIFGVTVLLPIFPRMNKLLEKRCLIWNRCGSSLAVGQRLTDVTSLSNVPQKV